MGLLRKIKTAPLEDRMNEELRKKRESDPFGFAEYDAANAERAGYSDYSYWKSTFRAFIRNRAAAIAFMILVVLLAFTVIQPFLPNQYPSGKIINHPTTQMQMSNVSPSLTTAHVKAKAGDVLIVTPYENSEWTAVSNVLESLKARTVFTVLEYGDEYCKVEYNGQTGYVKNDFSTKLKLPEDVNAVPYESRSNFPIKLYSAPADYTNNGDPLFVRTENITLEDNMATVIRDCDLHVLPSTAPFVFGTNNLGQDLWALVWRGTRTSLFIGFSVAVIEAFIGIVIGVLWGYIRKLDRLLTAVYNVVDNVPTTIVLILISYIMHPGIGTLIFAMCLTGWVGMARFIRNQIIIIRDRDYNLASRCLGSRPARIILRNLLPYLVSVIMLRMALAVPGAIGSEVFITYIGLGLPVSMPSLGNLINVGRRLISTSQGYQLLFPTIVLSIITISFYIIGNAFADAADPKNHT
ncbi:MAG: ABC transporter permease [Clostridia bacterium]|nr:ABC transporter permease [Clostridia bacterium]